MYANPQTLTLFCRLGGSIKRQWPGWKEAGSIQYGGTFKSVSIQIKSHSHKQNTLIYVHILRILSTKETISTRQILRKMILKVRKKYKMTKTNWVKYEIEIFFSYLIAEISIAM